MGRKGRQVFLGGLGLETQADDLRKLFAEIGGIVYVTVWKDSESGESRGAGKVEFETDALAQKAVESLRVPSAASSQVSFATAFHDGDASSLDVQYDKVIDWLITRRKLKETCRSTLSGFHTSVGLVQDKSPDEKEVTDLSKKGNAHLAEAACSIMQMVRHDIPSAKYHLQSCQKQADDLERRQRDLTQREAGAKQKLKDLCKTHQIDGNSMNFDADMKGYIESSLPKCLDKAVALIKASCPGALSFYEAFSRSLQAGEGDGASDLMPLLRFVVAQGNALLNDAIGLNQELKAELQKVQEQWKKGTISQDPASLRMLNNTRSRGLVVDELLELEAFLAERCWELEEIEKGQQQQNTNVKLQFNLEETKAFHRQINQAVEALSGKDVQPLLLMGSGDATLRNVISELSQQKALCDKPGEVSALLERRRAELCAEADNHSKEVDRLRQQVRDMKDWLEAEIARLMKHKVHLVGDINTV
jgi:hypothetical protein